MNYLNPPEIRSLLSMSECISVMRDLFLLNPAQDIINPLRPKMKLPNGGILGMMPAYIRPYNAMGIKVISVYLQNYQQGLSSHQGIVHPYGLYKIYLYACLNIIQNGSF